MNAITRMLMIGAMLGVAVTPSVAQMPIVIQHARPMDQRGLNVFEVPKHDSVTFTKPVMSLNAGFRQDFQGLGHSNHAAVRLVNGVNQNQLIQIGHGFNNAVANVYLNAQLAKGVRIQMTEYLSARHHNESWVKDGYALIDASPIDLPVLNAIMEHVTLKVGHFEINYGDQHFRRTDNGTALFNPFVGNFILDAFTTEVGGEVYVHAGSGFAMASVTNGEVKGTILSPDSRAPALIGKVGVDRQWRPDRRVRVTASTYQAKKSSSQTLYGGDRGGSPFYDVMENVSATETAQAWSGQIRNPFTNKTQAYVVNPFVKVGGIELFANLERSNGNNGATETQDRVWTQQAYDGVYRFAGDRLYAGARYNMATGKLAGIADRVAVRRHEVGSGWFVTPNVLAKIEWVDQHYDRFPSSDQRSGGRFRGFMIEGAVAW